MSIPTTVFGVGLHAIGGVSASTCYLPSSKVKGWSWGTFWIIQSVFAWLVMPLIIGIITVPDFFHILFHLAPSKPVFMAFALGALYGFGGMSFGLSIKHIGYSLTYTISIGISAVLGTIIPLIVFKGTDGLVAEFSKPGGGVVLSGMLLSVVGVGLCGWAGFKKEGDISESKGEKVSFNMSKGLLLAIIGGVLSGVFNISLTYGAPIAKIAEEHGAGIFQGNANLIVSTSGCFLVNIIWFLVAGIKDKSLVKDISNADKISRGRYLLNYPLSMLAGCMWTLQFFFYGLGHVHMGKFQFASWVIHMSMLIFFSYIVGVIMKEWKSVKRKTYIVLVIALLTLVTSFLVTTYGSILGNEPTAEQSNVEASR